MGAKKDKRADEESEARSLVVMGTLLKAKCSLVKYKAVTSWDSSGEVPQGATGIAAGPPEKVEDVWMVPLKPDGAVELRHVEIVKDGRARAQPDRSALVDAAASEDGEESQRKEGLEKRGKREKPEKGSRSNLEEMARQLREEMQLAEFTSRRRDWLPAREVKQDAKQMRCSSALGQVAACEKKGKTEKREEEPEKDPPAEKDEVAVREKKGKKEKREELEKDTLAEKNEVGIAKGTWLQVRAPRARLYESPTSRTRIGELSEGTRLRAAGAPVAEEECPMVRLKRGGFVKLKDVQVFVLEKKEGGEEKEQAKAKKALKEEKAEKAAEARRKKAEKEKKRKREKDEQASQDGRAPKRRRTTADGGTRELDEEEAAEATPTSSAKRARREHAENNSLKEAANGESKPAVSDKGEKRLISYQAARFWGASEETQARWLANCMEYLAGFKAKIGDTRGVQLFGKHFFKVAAWQAHAPLTEFIGEQPLKHSPRRLLLFFLKAAQGIKNDELFESVVDEAKGAVFIAAMNIECAVCWKAAKEGFELGKNAAERWSPLVDEMVKFVGRQKNVDAAKSMRKDAEVAMLEKKGPTSQQNGDGADDQRAKLREMQNEAKELKCKMKASQFLRSRIVQTHLLLTSGKGKLKLEGPLPAGEHPPEHVVDDLCKFLEEREEVRKNRESGQKPPWTTNRALMEFRFCNVFRCDDRTSKVVRSLLEQWDAEYRTADTHLARHEAVKGMIWNAGVYRLFGATDFMELLGRLEVPSAGDALILERCLRKVKKTMLRNWRRGRPSYSVAYKPAHIGHCREEGAWKLGIDGLHEDQKLYELAKSAELAAPHLEPLRRRCVGREGLEKAKKDVEEYVENHIRPLAEGLELAAASVTSPSFFWRGLCATLQLCRNFGPFCAKEVGQDLVGLSLQERCLDHDSWSPVGLGSANGIARLWQKTIDMNCQMKLCQCLRFLHAAACERKLKLPRTLSVHDLQFGVCEIRKLQEAREGKTKRRFSPEGSFYGVEKELEAMNEDTLKDRVEELHKWQKEMSREYKRSHAGEQARKPQKQKRGEPKQGKAKAKPK